MTEQASVLAVTTAKGELIAIVWHDMKGRHQTFFKVEEMNVEDIKKLLNNKDIYGGQTE